MEVRDPYLHRNPSAKKALIEQSINEGKMEQNRLSLYLDHARDLNLEIGISLEDVDEAQKWYLDE